MRAAHVNCQYARSGPPASLNFVVSRTLQPMNADSKRRVCRTGGVAAIVLAPLPFLVCFYQMGTTKVTDLAQDTLTYRYARLSAFLFVALVGVVFGVVLLLVGRHLRSSTGRVSA